MKENRFLTEAIRQAYGLCFLQKKQYITPEHLLLSIGLQEPFSTAMKELDMDPMDPIFLLQDYIDTIESMPDDEISHVDQSAQFLAAVSHAKQIAYNAERDEYTIPHVVTAILQLEESYAACILTQALGDRQTEFMEHLISQYEDAEDIYEITEEVYRNAPDLYGNDSGTENEQPAREEPWRSMVTCMNDTYTQRNPLIGREQELERTIQVLCRKDKNNPLHVGEPGVGKTALIYGLTARIVRGDVPDRLKGSRVYMMDVGSMIAGTQFRGDFEKRIKMVMDGAGREGNAIIYIDEIHNIVGAGSNGDSSLDASDLLKPYLESGQIRFIGSTTYEEYNRYFAQSKSLVRRFQQIDIAEPSIDDTITIVKGLKDTYEQFHGVTYSPGCIEFAVRATAKHITDRYLPDKAIDLLDEAGAYREAHPTDRKRQTVDKKLMGDILCRMCKIDAAALKETSNTKLADLRKSMKKRVFGQDEAIEKVVEAVETAKAGLNDERRPMANLLFVGPTGVGKTEVARTLADSLGVSLVRFDMSEYTEKHAVAKLIGAPAGYVGYDDGGLLTAAVRKTPNCVLLFDEIEKAHPDIYDIFLQIMDYASLTDNKGQKTDFRNAVIIMTSNAGAQYAGRSHVGFTPGATRGEEMLAQVKKTFKPEFVNRLTSTVVFHDMSRSMAALILDKKLGELQARLSARSVTLALDSQARDWLLEKGFTREYGAREIDRVVSSHLKPLLVHEILYGRLAKGGTATVTVADGNLKLSPEKA